MSDHPKLSLERLELAKRVNSEKGPVNNSRLFCPPAFPVTNHSVPGRSRASN